VLFRISHLPVQIKPIHEVEHLLKHITLLLLELTRIFSTSQHEHQIVPIPQHWRTAIGLHKSRDVFASHRPAKSLTTANDPAPLKMAGING
jgi:hypothetical protein